MFWNIAQYKRNIFNTGELFNMWPQPLVTTSNTHQHARMRGDCDDGGWDRLAYKQKQYLQ